MTTTEKRLERLEAIESIRALKVQYAQACDALYDPKLMAPLFTEDAVWSDVTGNFGTYSGRGAICEFFGGVSSQISWALHYMVGPVIAISNAECTEATGNWYLWQPCTLNGKAVWLAGTYRDEYRLEGEEWKMSRVELSIEKLTDFDEGWVRQPMVPGI